MIGTPRTGAKLKSRSAQPVHQGGTRGEGLTVELDSPDVAVACHVEEGAEHADAISDVARRRL